MSMKEYRDLIFEKSECEMKNDYGKWVQDPRFNEEENYYRRRLNMRGYFKDLAELSGIYVYDDRNSTTTTSSISS